MRRVERGLRRTGFVMLLAAILSPLFGSNAAQAQADLALSKAVSNPTPNVGDTVTYTITLTNAGPNTANTVAVTDLLPAGLAFVSATPSLGTYSSATGLWSVGTIMTGTPQTLQITAQVVSPSTSTNTATITQSDQSDGNAGNNSASASVIPQQADLALSKSGSNPTPNVGDTVTFTVTLSNAGPSPATSVTVTDLLPAGLTLVSATPSQGSYSSATGLWSVGTVTTGTPQTLQIQAQVVSPNTQTNTAVISHSDQFDPNTANNSASASIAAQQADLALSKSVSNPSPGVGTTVTYTITLSNLGPSSATNVTITDLLPAGLTFVSATPSQGSYSPATGLWSIGTVATATPQTLQITAQVVSPSTSTNTATVSHSDQFDPNTANNSASVSINPQQQADLALSKTVSNPNPSVGSTITYTITLSNLGPITATNVTVTDLLPAGLTFVSATPSLGTFNSGSGLWTIGTVTTGPQQTLAIVAQVTSSSTITNTATITHSDQLDPNPGNNSASIAINAAGNSAPTISKAFGAASIPIGGTTSLTFILANPNGATALTGVTFSDNFPGGLVVATPNGLASTCGGASTATAGSGNYSLTNGTLAAGGSCTVSLNVIGTTAGVKVNTTSPVVSVQAPNSATATATLTVGAVTTSTTLTSSRNPSAPGQAVTFTATVAASGGGAPTGTVTFMDAGSTIGTGTLSGGVATFTTSALAPGSHSITANYGGATGFSSSASSALAQVVGVPADSVRLRSLQLAITKIEAQASGSAFSGAVGGAIADGFSDSGGSLISANEGGVHINFAAEPGQQDVKSGVSVFDSTISTRESVLRGSGLAGSPSNPMQSSSNAARINDAFSSLAYTGTDPMPTKAPPRIAPATPKDWQIWADVRGTGWSTDVSAGDIHGSQVNAFVGITRRLTPNFLVGVVGGYENFDYTSNTLNGRLKGDGWTVGGYLGWRLWDGLRFNAAVGRSGISYDGVAGTASATFPGSRWIASADLIGTYRIALLEIEPSAKVYALWERDNQYLDSLGTLQSTNDFSTGRASGGIKIAYPWHLSSLTTITPFVGIYGDYYFSSSNVVPLLLPTEFVQGWSARVTAGINYNMVGGAKLTLGGELGGLGNDFTVWSVRGRASLPF